MIFFLMQSRASCDRMPITIWAGGPSMAAVPAAIPVDTRDGTSMTRHRLLAIELVIIATLAAMLCVQPTMAQSGGPEIIRSIVVEGNERVDQNRILSQMRLRVGAGFTPEAANDDIQRIFALREFDDVQIRPEPVDDGILLRVKVLELPLLSEVTFEGNEKLSDKRLHELTGVRAGEALDRNRLVQAPRLIQDEYREKGYYFANVTLDRQALEEGNVARFQINEGPRVLVRGIRFKGNYSIPDSALQDQIETKTRFWPLRTGAYDEEEIQRDVQRLRAYYVGQGFLDVDVSRAVTFDDKRERAYVEYIINEGIRYQVASVTIRDSRRILSSAYLAENMQLQPGEFLTTDAMQSDARDIAEAYGRIGYVHAEVTPRTQYTAEPGTVDLLVQIDAGPKIRIGEIIVAGNERTLDKVVLRELRFYPEEVADGKAINDAKRRLSQLRLFGDAQLTLLPTEDQNVNDVLVTVDEAQTGSLIFGAGINSNNGLVGNIMLDQNNFDISRLPRYWGDDMAFRGAGQRAYVSLEPGTQYQQYRIGFMEPYLFDRSIRFHTSASYYDRDRNIYDESRLGGDMSFGHEIRRDIMATLGVRLEQIRISDVDRFAPDDVFDVEGKSILTGVSMALTRDKTDSLFRPTTGSRMTGEIEQAGAMGGDYTFTKFYFDARRFWTIREDDQFRRSVFSLRGRTGVAIGDPPIFERFYAGGTGSIRGFRYRGVGPFQRDEPIGGDFLLLANAEYEFPLYGKNLSGVVFLDTGTVETSAKISTYRAAAGFGFRLTIDMFGQPVPFMLDFGFPISKHSDDETQVFSFNISWNF